MNSKRFSLLLGAAVLALAAGGCASYSMLIDFNGRTIEVEDVKQVSVHRGLEVTSFDGHLMKVNGREAVTVNGKDLTVKESTVSHGTSRHTLGPQQKLIIEKGERFSIVDQKDAAQKGWWEFWK